MNSGPDVIKIGNCSGFFGDRQGAARELVETARLDVLTGDWLAELTMLILQRQRAKDPLKGFASTFIDQVEQVLGACIDQGTRIVSNAGGLNPAGCAAAVRAVADRLGLRVTVGHVSGDDLLPRIPALAASDALTSLDTGAPLSLSTSVLAANAYLGGWGIASCLERGADVVVTGRVTDASLVVGPCAWRFGWREDAWDSLAGAVVAGHIIECGGQATGGNYSYFRHVPGMSHIGFPIAEVHSDGSSVITKPDGSGGEVSVGTVTAQLLYEVAGARYANPDVTALLDTVALSPEGADRVRVTGIRGEPPPTGLKVSLALEGGHRNAMLLALTGDDAEAKAVLAEQAVWELIPGGRAAFDAVDVELLGRAVPDASTIGEATSLLRIAVASSNADLAGRVFSSAVIGTALCSYPGFFTTTPPTQSTAFARFCAAVVPAADVVAVADVDGDVVTLTSPGAEHGQERPQELEGPPDDGPAPTLGLTRRVPLGALVGARSGDKGGHANLGVWVNDRETFAWLDEHMTAVRLRQLIPEIGDRVVRRHRFANLLAVNFVIEGLLGEGVSSCLRFDGQAKGLAEFLRARHMDVPAALLSAHSTN